MFRRFLRERGSDADAGALDAVIGAALDFYWTAR